MIYPEAPNYDNSPWYKIMEERAIAWQKFAEENSFLTHGVYAANHVSFKIGTFNKDTLIRGKRSLISVNAGVFSMDGVFNERLILKIKKPIKDRNTFLKINRSSIFNTLRKKHKNSCIINDYYINYDKHEMVEKLKSLDLFDFKKLNKLVINRHGIKLDLSELPLETQTINTLITYFNSL